MKKIVMLLMVLVLAINMAGCQKDDDMKSTVTSANAVVTDALSKIETSFKTKILDGATKVDGRYAVPMEDSTAYFKYTITGNKFILTIEAKRNETYIIGIRITATVNDNGSITTVEERLNKNSGKLEVIDTNTYSNVDDFFEDM